MCREGTGAAFVCRDGTGAVFVHRDGLGDVFVLMDDIQAVFVCREGIGAAFGTSLVWLTGPERLGVQTPRGCWGHVRAQPGARPRLAALPRAAPGRQETGSLLAAPSPGKNHVL